MHASAQIGFFNTPESESVSLFNAWLGVVVNAIGNTGVTCFVLLSGYFGVKYTSHKFLHLVLTVTLYSVLLYSLFQLAGIYRKCDFVEALLAVPLYHNWFIVCYLFLMLVAPYLNGLAENLKRKDYTRLLVILFIALSLMPTLFKHTSNSIITSGGKCISYFLFIYLLGRYISIYKCNFRFAVWRLTTCLISCLIVITAYNGIIMLLENRYSGGLARDNSPLILIASVCIFLLFGSINIRSRLINNVAKSVLAVYILNDIFHIIDSLFIHLSNYAFSPLSLPMLLVEVLITFVACVVIDKLKVVALGRLEEWIVGKTMVLSHRLKHS